MMGKNFLMHSFGAAAFFGVLTMPAPAEVAFEWVTVGDPGNAEDPLNSATIPGIGSVAIEYRIAKHEVTNDQYTECLNAVAGDDTNSLYNAAMGSDARGGITQSGTAPNLSYAVKTNMGNKPVVFVSYFDAMRFVNWLHNGQPTGGQNAGTTEDGVYAVSDGASETRAVDAQFFMPTENEWYKAAYHQPSGQGGDVDNYWLYPTATNTPPTVATANAAGDIDNPGVNVVNYDWGADWNGQDGNLTTVGSAGVGSESFYGTSDQGGNLREWLETTNPLLPELGLHFQRGGVWRGILGTMWSSTRSNDFASAETFDVIGFRVASPVAAEPVPAVSEWGLVITALLLLTAGTILMRYRRPLPRTEP